MSVYPGQEIQLQLVGLDQFVHPTYLIARISDSRADINTGAFSQSTDDDFINNMVSSCPSHAYIAMCAYAYTIMIL